MVSIDSRTIKKGDTFLAIKGQRYDGHDFVREAFGKGAREAIVSKGIKLPSRYRHRLVRVKDTVEALGEIAKSHRSKFNIPVIAITGSNGKTTTKEMAAFLLFARYRVLKNEASQNNLIGLPLTLLKLERRHELIVLEMGMNRPGEIGRLCEIAMPRIGVITNIGPSHLEFLGTIENVFRAKSELLARLPKKGLAVLNKDDKYLSGIKGLKCKKLYFGIEKKCNFQAKGLRRKRSGWSFSVEPGRPRRSTYEVDLRGRPGFGLSIPGKHNIYNALIAIALGREFGIKVPLIKKRLKAYKQAPSKRLEFKNIHGLAVLDDSYNSNPASMECAVNTIAEWGAKGKKILVSGDMLELGKSAENLHERVGEMIAENAVDILVTLGRFSKFVQKGARRRGMQDLYHAASHNDAANFLKKIAKPSDVILVKGSRGMRMEKIIEKL